MWISTIEYIDIYSDFKKWIFLKKICEKVEHCFAHKWNQNTEYC
jgi:hypothetical protein